MTLALVRDTAALALMALSLLACPSRTATPVSPPEDQDLDVVAADAAEDAAPPHDSAGETGADTAADSAPDTPEDVPITLPCQSADDGVVAGTMALPDLIECSGLVASRSQPGVLWAHNDSGAGPVIYALATDGSHLGTFGVTGATHSDWEDIALAPGVEGSADRLIVADIGDNYSQRPSVTLWIVDEPEVPSPGGVDSVTAPAQPLPVIYPDGPHDAESLLVDPTDGVVYIITKAWDTGISGLYRYPPPLEPEVVVTLEKVGDIPLDDLGGGGAFLATGADISPDGAWLALRTYDNVLAWYRPPGTPLAAALSSTRCHWVQQKEPQGESIAFTPDGSGYYTLSESEGQPLWRFDLTP